MPIQAPQVGRATGTFFIWRMANFPGKDTHCLAIFPQKYINEKSRDFCAKLISKIQADFRKICRLIPPMPNDLSRHDTQFIWRIANFLIKGLPVPLNRDDCYACSQWYRIMITIVTSCKRRKFFKTKWPGPDFFKFWNIFCPFVTTVHVELTDEQEMLPRLTSQLSTRNYFHNGCRANWLV